MEQLRNVESKPHGRFPLSRSIAKFKTTHTQVAVGKTVVDALSRIFCITCRSSYYQRRIVFRAWMCPAIRGRKPRRGDQTLDMVSLNNFERPLLELSGTVVGKTVVPKHTQMMYGSSRTRHEDALFPQRSKGSTKRTSSLNEPVGKDT